MPRFAANLSMLFTELEFRDRFAAADGAGFPRVECLFPYDFDAGELRSLLDANGLEQVLHNLPAGDWAAGERGIACLPDRVEEFRAGVAQAVEFASALGCRQLNCLAGIASDGADPNDLRTTLVANLEFSACELSKAGITLLLEAINTRDIPGFFVSGTSQARAIVEEVGAPNLGLQYDIYHMQIMEGDLARTIEENLGLIRHLQLADNPGRHEPGTGEINYPFLFRHFDRIGYEGWIGCEYVPRGNTIEGLGWIEPYL